MKATIFAALALSTNFSNLVNADSSCINIYGIDKKISLQLDFIHKITIGTYSFGPAPLKRAEVKGACSIGSLAFNNDNKILSG